jgi:hypothetical protein
MLPPAPWETGLLGFQNQSYSFFSPQSLIIVSEGKPTRERKKNKPLPALLQFWLPYILQRDLKNFY